VAVVSHKVVVCLHSAHLGNQPVYVLNPEGCIPLIVHVICASMLTQKITDREHRSIAQHERQCGCMVGSTGKNAVNHRTFETVHIQYG
jgi:hypothetical protein